jgi:energy-coupling factor transporter transmembrane protein EcfT
MPMHDDRKGVKGQGLFSLFDQASHRLGITLAIFGSLRTTSVMAMVVDARAFGSHPKRSTIREHPITFADFFALGLLVALTITVVILVILHIGNRQL